MKTEELVKPLEIREDGELDENKDKVHLEFHWIDIRDRSLSGVGHSNACSEASRGDLQYVRNEVS